jgi:hypothetical protein
MGTLQAAQADNQLLALQSQQLSDLAAVPSAKDRADALEQARSAFAEASMTSCPNCAAAARSAHRIRDAWRSGGRTAGASSAGRRGARNAPCVFVSLLAYWIDIID